MNCAAQRGAVAESIACTWALNEGYLVSFPARGLAPYYDMIVDKHGRLYRVQVKRAHRRDRGPNGQLRVSLTNRNGALYDGTGIDAFVIVDVDNKTIWWFPIEDVLGTASLGLEGSKHDKYIVKGK